MEYPKRKHPRLKQYDYRLPGYYYVTIHIAQNAPILSHIRPGPQVCLTATGAEARRQLSALEARFPFVKLEKSVIMPTHIHMILRLTQQEPATENRPGLPLIIGVYKSLTTRSCNERDGLPGRRLFQTSFYETVIRNERQYQECWRYLEGNPSRWLVKQEAVNCGFAENIFNP